MITGEFSHYRVLSRLGQGGMGEVYLAEDRSLRRKVALKFLLGTPGDPEVGRLLLREARAAAQLDHPFICKVYEVDEQQGRPFIAMEFVEGQTLKERIGPGGLPLPAALAAAVEIADALQFAHARGVVHRDLKPANVMVAADGHVKVMDFGIAKVSPAAAGNEASTIASLARPGEPIGTLAYMSPEQVRGENVDARSDVFAFGILLYELVTGSNPFMRGSAVETATAILNDLAPSLQVRSSVPPLLAHVVERCLQKDPQRRYRTLGDVRVELQSIGDTAPPARRSNRRLVAALVVVAVIAAGAGLSWIRPLPFFTSDPVLAFKERDWIVVADFNNLTGDKVFDRSLRLALEVAIAQSQYVNVYPPDRVSATLQRMNRWPVERFDENLAAEVAEREGVRGVLACDIAQIGGTYALTARVIKPSDRQAVLSHSVTAATKDAVLGALDELSRHVRNRLGESTTALASQARPLPRVTTSSLEALKLYADSMREDRSGDEMLRNAIRVDPQFALAYAELGRRLYLRSDRAAREEGEKHFKTALSLIDRLSLRERLWINAIAEDSRGRRPQAVVAYEAYLAQYPEDSRARFRLGWTQMAGMREYAKAVEEFKRVVAAVPEDSSAWVNLGSAYSGVGDTTNAIPAYERAFDIDPPLLLGVFVNHEYGFALVKAGRPADAAAAFEKMKTKADPASLRARGFRSAAVLAMYRGKYNQAIAELRQALVFDQTYGQGLSEFRDRLYLLAALEARGMDRVAAPEWAALNARIATLSLTPDWLALPVRMHARRGRLAEARRLIDLMPKTAGQSVADASVARNTALDQAYVDLATAEVEMASGRPERAIALLEPAALMLKESGAPESLARAYAAGGRTDQAIARYEEFVKAARVGNETQEPWQVAFADLAKLYERAGRIDDSRRLYGELVERWKDGDPDLPLLVQAKAALARLGPAAAR